MPESLFRRDGETVIPTRLTQGPWSPDAQHGGPPSAVLAGAIEKAPSDAEMVVARVSIELLRPVPLEPLRLSTETVRPGRNVQLVAARLDHGEQTVATAVGLRIRRTELDLPFEQPEDDLPEVGVGRPVTFFERPGAFAEEAAEILMVDGDFSEPGPGRAWIRLRVPLIDGEETTAVERVAAAADFGNGVSNLAGGTGREWLFINPDLTLRLHRPPRGQWTFLDSSTRVSTAGTGLATSRVADEEGWVGVAAQSLLIDRLPSG